MSKDDTGGNGDGELWVWHGNGSVNDGLGCMRDNRLINPEPNHKDNNEINNNNKKIIQKNNEIQYIIQPKIMSNVKQTETRRRWDEYESK